MKITANVTTASQSIPPADKKVLEATIKRLTDTRTALAKAREELNVIRDKTLSESGMILAAHHQVTVYPFARVLHDQLVKEEGNCTTLIESLNNYIARDISKRGLGDPVPKLWERGM